MSTISGTPRPTSMPRIETQNALRCDGLVLFVVGALMTLGAVMVYSASASLTDSDLNWRHWHQTSLRQSVFALFGFFAMAWVARLDYRLWAWERRGDGWWSGTLFVLAFLLLLAMLIPGIGESRLGARRALVVLRSPISLSFQPAEFAKVVMVIWMAAVLTQPGRDIKAFKHGFLPVLIGAGLLAGLTGIEDFGTAALMGVIMFAMLALAGAHWLHLTGFGLTGFLAGLGLLMLKPYRWERIQAWWSGDIDPSGSGYQVTQSLIAIGGGGWWGRGLGNGVQKYGYLPQDNNDFIFSIVCEELGVVGGLVVIGLFLFLLWRGWRISRQALDPFGRLLAAGITLMLCLQAAFNVGVVTNAVPTKGISLPFVSAGGSGVLFLGVAAGLLASVGRRERT